jgi:hypothetical protein
MKILIWFLIAHLVGPLAKGSEVPTKFSANVNIAQSSGIQSYHTDIQLQEHSEVPGLWYFVEELPQDLKLIVYLIFRATNGQNHVRLEYSISSTEKTFCDGRVTYRTVEDLSILEDAPAITLCSTELGDMALELWKAKPNHSRIRHFKRSGHETKNEG